MKEYVKILCVVLFAFTVFALLIASLGIPFAIAVYFDSLWPLLLLPFTFAGFIWFFENAERRWR